MYVHQYADILTAINDQQRELCNTYTELAKSYDNLKGATKDKGKKGEKLTSEFSDKFVRFDTRLISALRGFVDGTNVVTASYNLDYENKTPTVEEVESIAEQLSYLFDKTDDDYNESVKLIEQLVRRRLLGTPTVRVRERERM